MADCGPGFRCVLFLSANHNEDKQTGVVDPKMRIVQSVSGMGSGSKFQVSRVFISIKTIGP